MSSPNPEWTDQLIASLLQHPHIRLRLFSDSTDAAKGLIFVTHITHSLQKIYVLEIGPKGWANRHDGRLLRLTFDTNSCKYNVLSLGFSTHPLK